MLERVAGLLGVIIALDRQRQAVREINLASALCVGEGRNRRAEDRWRRMLRGVGRREDRSLHELRAVVGDGRAGDEHRRCVLRVVAERAPGHERAVVGIPEEPIYESREVVAVGLENKGRHGKAILSIGSTAVPRRIAWK
jgi:hypothetical protein